MSTMDVAQPVRSASWRWADRGATAVLGLTAALLVVLVVLRLAGFTTLVERSGSMAPAIQPGDLLLTHAVSTADIRPRDVVSFDDPGHPDVSTTHRVVALSQSRDNVLLTTRGDANEVAEQWPAPRSGRVARVAQRMPYAGYVVSAFGNRWVRLALLTATLTGLTALALRRIWRTG